MIYILPLNYIFIVEICCLGSTLGMFVYSIVSFGIGGGNPSYVWHIQRRVIYYCLAHLVWLGIFIYSSIKFINNLSICGIIVAIIIYILSFSCGKSVCCVIEKRYLTSCKRYIIMFYLIHTIHIYFLINTIIRLWI